MSFQSRKTVVAIPVRNEEARLHGCLTALARQSLVPDHIFLLLNNCTDNSAEIAGAAAAARTEIVVSELQLPAPRATAGEARRLALAAAAALAGPDGVIITTDADCQPGPDWVAKNLQEIARGADVVCGAARIVPEPGQAISLGLYFDLARESMYASLLDEIASLVDPDPADPWPRHQQHSGASIAMTTDILKQAGGAPHVASGEDRALIARLRAVDARIRHAQIPVVVSGRLEGRAAGGMAETIKRRICQPDTFADEACEPAVDAYRRALAKARLREAKRDGFGGQSLGTDLLISRPILQKIMREKFFGTAWAALQKASPVLQRRRVRMADLTRETAQAQLLYEQYLYEPVFDTQFTGDTQIAR